MIKKAENVDFGDEASRNIKPAKALWNGHGDNPIAQLTRCECQAFLYAAIMEVKEDIAKVQKKLKEGSSDDKFSHEEQVMHRGRIDGLDLAVQLIEKLNDDFARFTGYHATEEDVNNKDLNLF